MNWGKIGDIVGSAAPLIGGLLGGPAGAGAGALIAKTLGCESTPMAVSQAIQNDPTALVKIKQVESEERVAMANLALEEKQMIVDAGSKDIATVNTTMQAEAKSEDAWTRRWRPFNGFMFGITMFMVYFFLPFTFGLLKALIKGCPELVIPKIEYFVWVAWASVLGVASWHRGMKQRLDSGEVGAPGIMGAIANRLKR